MKESKEITLDELSRRIEKHGPEVAMKNVKVSGIVTILDKDGNEKSKLDIVSLETQEPNGYAT